MIKKNHKAIISILTVLMIVTSVGGFEKNDTSLDIDKPYNTTNFTNISGPDDEVLEHVNSNPVNQKHSDYNWMVDNQTQVSSKEQEKTLDQVESEERTEQDIDSDSNSETTTIVRTDRSWSTMSATLSHNSANPNETVYIEGSIHGDRKRNASVFLGDEKVSEVGPLNGSFRIPVEVSEIDGRELSLQSNGRISTFDLKVIAENNSSKSVTEKDCINFPVQERLGFESTHNDSLIEKMDVGAPCFNPSIPRGSLLFEVGNQINGGAEFKDPEYEILDNPFGNFSHDIDGNWTEGNEDRIVNEGIFGEISSDMEQVQRDIEDLLESISI